MNHEKKILILFAHLDFQHSKIQRAMVDAVRGLPFIRFHNVLESYPDFFIDVEQERESLEWANLIVFQFPVYWYSTPAILKHWQDTVLTRGYAYGKGGNALRGKDFMVSLSSGGNKEAYTADGVHGRPLDEFLYPLQQMARFCGMNWLSPKVLQGGHDLGQAVIDGHAVAYAKFLEAYANGEKR
jgi:glutathione-regulated potassium-efflux system ancillary protein KefF